MKDLCGMCGERKSEQELCRSDNHNDRWRVCLECACTMLENPDLSGMWQPTGHAAALGHLPSAAMDGRT